MLASGVAEVVSLAAVVPFLAVLSDPQRLWQLPLIRNLSPALGITAANELMLPITLLFVLATILAAAVRLLNLWLSGRLAAGIGSDLSCEAYRRTLHQPYAVHLKQNSSKAITTITTQTQQLVLVLDAILQLLSAAVVALGLIISLFFMAWTVAFAAVALFGSSYLLLSVTVRKRLDVNSNFVAEASQQQLKALQEGLGAIRDVILDGNQTTYLEIFRRADRPMRLRQSESRFFAAFPRYALEALGLLLISLVALVLSWQQGNSLTVISLIGILALASQRLLPVLQLIYYSWAQIRSLGAAVYQVLQILDLPVSHQSLQKAISPLSLRKSVRLESLRFRYGEDSPWVLDAIDIEIRQGERIGLIGSTGSGKSTLLDIMMGLLTPTEGRILVDEVDLNDPSTPRRLTDWRAAIAHVPQSIFLSDSSIAENIAFGIQKDLIDMARVRKAAEQAHIAGFIESGPEGYEQLAGERGIRLSGGQRQRIGIARALYKQARVIVLDEATSALDTPTEDLVMGSLEDLSRELTLVMIAHRLSTLSNCDRIFRLAQGLVTEEGPPSLLCQS